MLCEYVFPLLRAAEQVTSFSLSILQTCPLHIHQIISVVLKLSLVPIRAALSLKSDNPVHSFFVGLRHCHDVKRPPKILLSFLWNRRGTCKAVFVADHVKDRIYTVCLTAESHLGISNAIKPPKGLYIADLSHLLFNR